MLLKISQFRTSIESDEIEISGLLADFIKILGSINGIG